ncbi:CoA transferase [Oceanibaculum indicum]|uniref:Crotonobetainyl-CoA:carnitine CoA-transferase CaiB-like acyl-CoA transferase n=1 Tax=Oceanibaculum indicum TaxID=526216 RepID=A0A420WSN7_9PROT|nr:CoA transferase [Oceanibaculum indicum]RKQ73856.1 crotonobetainyl-CoA:carnitine CoA-transferase CaiB-like acyl-CoA transferase [Oceanibaculum indicum]
MPSHAPTSPSEALAGLWRLLGQPEAALSRVTLTGAEPALPSSFAVGTAAQASIAASALAAAELDRLRSGREQSVSVDMRHAAVEFRSERYLRVGGGPAPELWDSIAGTYRCGDGRWVRLHTNFPHHRDGVLAILGCAGERVAVAEALKGWKAEAFEHQAAEARLVVTAMRSFAEWDAHPQGQAVAALPVMSLEKIGDAPPLTLPPDERPLSGVRVLDLTRIIAGPVAGRTLAAHGADVLLVTAPHLPSVEPLVIDTGRGKRTTQLDLRAAADKERFTALLRDAHVLVQGYRPGGIEALGFGPAQAAAIRPGIIYVTLSAYGPDGPWAGRRGFDSLVQTASGLNVAEAEAAGIDGPKPLPAQALDHASGYLMAYGAMAALARQMQEGGSWHVRVSLAQTGHWLRGLGRIKDGFSAPDPSQEDVADLLEESQSGFGRLSAVRHAGLLSETPPVWERPSMPLGSHEPVWL